MTPGESGTLYRAGYEEKTPQDFMDTAKWPGIRFNPNHPGTDCWACDEALAAYESWRLNQIKPSKPSELPTYPQAVEIIRSLVRGLPGAAERGFSYEGEWRDRNWLESVLEVVLKGDPK